MRKRRQRQLPAHAYAVCCWNCDEGFVEPVDEWDDGRCDVCDGKGFLIVTELTEDNAIDAVALN